MRATIMTAWVILVTITVGAGGTGAVQPRVPDKSPRLQVEPPNLPGNTPEFAVRVVKIIGKTRTTLGEWPYRGQPIRLPSEGTCEVWIVPRGGLAVRVTDKLTITKGTTTTISLSERLGAIRIFGDGLPRPARVVVTPVRDPGPGRSGHVAVQQAAGFRVNMLVPPGRYEVWLVPANGAAAERIAENVRVFAGQVHAVDD